MEETGNQELRKRMKKRTKVEDGRRGQGMEKEKNHCLRVRQEEKITQCKQAGKSEERGVGVVGGGEQTNI